VRYSRSECLCTEDKSYDTNYSFYEELELSFDHFRQFHLKIFRGDLNAEVEREDIFKLSVGNESLHETSNDNRIRVVNVATTKYLVVKVTTLPLCTIHKFTFRDNHIARVSVDRR
jgi:hypothetical protein